MKKILQILTLMILLISSKKIISQELKIDNLKNEKLVKVLNNAQLIGENRENWVSVRVFKIDNETGSAKTESGEITHNLLIAISEFDEKPEQNLFEIGPFYNPKFETWVDLKDYEKIFQIKYGGVDEIKKIRLKVNLKKLELID